MVTKHRLVWSVCSAVIVSLAAAFAPLRAVVSADAGTLQQDVNALQNAGNAGVLAEVQQGGRISSARAGLAQIGGTDPVPLNGRYRTGSVTKTFVSVALLQLVGEGRLSLDDTVDHWLPGVVTGNGNDGHLITVRQLLNHTAGLFDYTNDDAFFATVATPAAFYANRYNHYSPQDLIAIALSHPPAFASGTSWGYSNTDYIVAGEIIKAVTGHTWDTEVTNRIITPLGLTGTRAPGDDATISGPHASGYHIYTSSPSNRVYTDTTEDNMSWADAAGALITTTADENTFFSALLSGQLLPPAQLAQMQTLVPLGSGVGYGLGIIGQQLHCSNQMIWWHNGGTVGYNTWAGITADGQLGLTLSLSTTSFDDATFLTNTGNLTSKLIRHVFCGSQQASDDNFQAPHARLF